MSGIMVDNWFMDEVLFSMPDDSACCSKAYADLLDAIILWDQVFYPCNTCSMWSANETPLKYLLTPIDDWNEEGNEEAVKAFMLDEHIYNDQQSGLSPLDRQIIGSGALRYAALSAKNGLDYLPCSMRREYLKNHLSSKEFESLLSQLKAQGFIDSLISDQISSIFQPLLSSSNFLIETPDLAQYVIDQTPPDMTPADFAFHLREEGPTVRYRQYLEELSDAFKSEDTQKLGYLQSLSKDVVSDVLTRGKRKLKSICFKLFPNISFSANTSSGEFVITVSPFGISVTLGIPAKTFCKKNLTFLTDITRYAAKNSHIK